MRSVTMSDPVLIALITGIPATLTAISTVITSAKLNRIRKIAKTTSENVNGRMDQMLTIQHEKSYLQGVSDTKKEEKNVQPGNVPA
jgi:hypothetical protein